MHFCTKILPKCIFCSHSGFRISQAVTQDSMYRSVSRVMTTGLMCVPHTETQADAAMSSGARAHGAEYCHDLTTGAWMGEGDQILLFLFDFDYVASFPLTV